MATKWEKDHHLLDFGGFDMHHFQTTKISLQGLPSFSSANRVGSGFEAGMAGTRSWPNTPKKNACAQLPSFVYAALTCHRNPSVVNQSFRCQLSWASETLRMKRLLEIERVLFQGCWQSIWPISFGTVCQQAWEQRTNFTIGTPLNSSEKGRAGKMEGLGKWV